MSGVSEPFKICPICDTANHRNSGVCSNCGATLTRVDSREGSPDRRSSVSDYASQYGETDLLEASAPSRGGGAILIGLGAVLVMVCGGIGLVIGLQLASSGSTSLFDAGSQALIDAASRVDSTSPAPLATNTARLALPTVTPGPPTLTPTPTPSLTPTQGPCLQQVQPNDSLIAVLVRCGHQDYTDLVPIVLELNNLADANQIQVGQTIEVPWPTPTVDPNATLTESAGLSVDVAVGVDSNPRDAAGVRLRPTPTLPAGVTWHRVQAQENIISIALSYGASLRILSELNPEIGFPQCDFGLGSGGPNCVVLLAEGQLVRVPAPTPTPTVQPTASGSETPTPTATPTLNIPTILGPSDRAFFRADELITLRWVGTGSLGPNEVYRVRVADQTGGGVFQADTTELFFILPDGWRGLSQDRHIYVWNVAVVRIGSPDVTVFETGTREFTWEGQANAASS